MNGAATWLAAGAVAVLTHGAAVAGLGAFRAPSAPDRAESPSAVRLAVNLVSPPVAQAPPPIEPRPPRAEPVVTEPPAVIPEEPAATPIPGIARESAVPELLSSIPVPAVHRVSAPQLVPPRALAQPRPRYPLAARRRGLEGTVRCRVEVSSSGELIEIDVVATSGHKALDRAAIRAIEETPFASAELAGRHVEGSLTIAVRFVLN